jgi:spermidine/putrescine ABC transporter ATP-binding subunit
MSTDQIHLQFQNVSKSYGDVKAVDNISIDVYREEFLTLLGASGSGKTTMLMTLAGFIMPDQGNIILDGQDITFQPPSKRQIGVVFQSYALFPHMTVATNVAYPLKVRKVPRHEMAERVEKALQQVQLGGFGDRMPDQLSGGQQQRVALARALVFEPKLLLMDEPLGALDKKLREYMQLEIKHLQQELKITVIYVTHDQSEALTMSDRVAIMEKGHFQQLGPPQELYRAPANRFVGDFIGETSFLKATVDNIDGHHVKARIGSAIVRFPATGTPAIGADVEIMVRPEAVDISSEAREDANQLDGLVAEAVYLGEYTRYHVRLPDGQIIMIKRRNIDGVQPLQTNDQVSMSWSVNDTHEVLSTE